MVCSGRLSWMVEYVQDSIFIYIYRHLYLISIAVTLQYTMDYDAFCILRMHDLQWAIPMFPGKNQRMRVESKSRFKYIHIVFLQWPDCLHSDFVQFQTPDLHNQEEKQKEWQYGNLKPIHMFSLAWAWWDTPSSAIASNSWSQTGVWANCVPLPSLVRDGDRPSTLEQTDGDEAFTSNLLNKKSNP